MPVSLKRLPSGKLVLLTACELPGCTREAPYGRSVHYRKALLALEGGDKVKAKRLLGNWYCGEHVRDQDTSG